MKINHNSVTLVIIFSTLAGLINLEQWPIEKAQLWYDEQGILNNIFTDY